MSFSLHYLRCKTVSMLWSLSEITKCNIKSLFIQNKRKLFIVCKRDRILPSNQVSIPLLCFLKLLPHFFARYFNKRCAIPSSELNCKCYNLFREIKVAGHILVSRFSQFLFISHNTFRSNSIATRKQSNSFTLFCLLFSNTTNVTENCTDTQKMSIASKVCTNYNCECKAKL